MLRKRSVGVVFIGGDIFGTELARLELALPHQHVEPEFSIVIRIQRMLRDAIAWPISRRSSARIVAPLLQYLRDQLSCVVGMRRSPVNGLGGSGHEHLHNLGMLIKEVRFHGITG